jgi:glyoxylase-like metal-dependent hydrolase (beta-lactamase superfamily II)
VQKEKLRIRCDDRKSGAVDARNAARCAAEMGDEQSWRRQVRTIRGVMGVCHLLVEPDGRGAVLLDTGLVGESGQIRRAVGRLGLEPRDVRAILLTHGHLDHAGNLAWAQAWSGAKIYAHAVEQAHIDGTFPYRGVNRWCGRLERAGRALLGVGAPAKIDVTITDGEELPFWGGLRVVHLPGHTLGHCGFYSARHDVLFSGDLFASYFFKVHLPPPILNSAPELIPGSLEKARALGARYMVPQHYDVLDGALHRRRFDAMLERRARRRSERGRTAI